MKASRILVATAVLSFAAAGSALAFHEGGVATCDGCHTMHNSYGGVKMTVNTPGALVSNAYLLKGADQSSTCLKCHAGTTSATKDGGYKIATYPVPAAGSGTQMYTPGGDFAWMQKGYTWTQPRNGSSPAERHGHNILASDYGFIEDTTLATAPGSTYPKAKLACSSCHDPHGKYRVLEDGSTVTSALGTAVLPIGLPGSYGGLPDADEAVGAYRLLAGVGYQPASLTGSFAFAKKPPIAIAPKSYNTSENAAQIRVAYGSGMSEWCANCHGGIHNDSYPTNLRHPAGNGAKLTSVVANYNAYKKSGDLTGVKATAYDTLVPFEIGLSGTNADRTTLLTYAAGGANAAVGAEATNNAMCLSCHRAHATGFISMSRWNNNTEFLTVGGGYADASLAYDSNDEKTYRNFADGKTAAEYQAAMNGRKATDFAFVQRSLCNKCHAKD